MSLTTDQIRHFRQGGYTTAPEFFSEREVMAMRAEIDRLRREGAFQNVSTNGDGKTKSSEKENLQICPLFKRSKFFRALPFSRKVMEAIPSLIGPEVILHLDQIFLKPAHRGSPTNWHQDNAYFQISDPMKGTAMWIAVHDATVANGTIRVIPGVAREKFEHGRDPDSNHHIRCWPPEEKAVHLELPAGGVAFFCYGLPHATGANQTNGDRAGLAYHFLASDIVNPDKPPAINTILTGPGASFGEKEYGVDLRDEWERQVDQALCSV